MLVGALWWSAAAAQSELVIYKEDTNLYHRPGCDVIRDMKGVVAMTRAQAESRGYKAHADCDPAVQQAWRAGAPPPPPRRRRSPRRRPSTSTAASITTGRTAAGSAANPKAARAEPLDVAGKSLWPCPDCRPPVRPRQGTSPRLGRVR